MSPETLYFEAKPTKPGKYSGVISFFLEGYPDDPIKFKISGNALNRFSLDKSDYAFSIDNPVIDLQITDNFPDTTGSAIEVILLGEFFGEASRVFSDDMSVHMSVPINTALIATKSQIGFVVKVRRGSQSMFIAKNLLNLSAIDIRPTILILKKSNNKYTSRALLTCHESMSGMLSGFELHTVTLMDSDSKTIASTKPKVIKIVGNRVIEEIAFEVADFDGDINDAQAAVWWDSAGKELVRSEVFLQQ